MDIIIIIVRCWVGCCCSVRLAQCCGCGSRDHNSPSLTTGQAVVKMHFNLVFTIEFSDTGSASTAKAWSVGLKNEKVSV